MADGEGRELEQYKANLRKNVGELLFLRDPEFMRLAMQCTSEDARELVMAFYKEHVAPKVLKAIPALTDSMACAGADVLIEHIETLRAQETHDGER